MSSVRLFSILSALFTAGLAAPALAQDDVFVDRFQAGIQRAVVDGGASWWRRGSGIEVRLACDTASEVQVVASPGGDWVFAFGELPVGVVEIGNGVLEVELECPDGEISTVVTATNESLPEFSDVAGIVFGEQPRITSLYDVLNDQEILASNGTIDVDLTCGSQLEGALLARPQDREWVFAYDNTSEGITTSPEGLIEAHYTCPNGPNTLFVDAQANSNGFSTGIVRVNLNYMQELNPPVFTGLDVTGNGLADFENNNGEFSSDIHWVKNFPLEGTFIGEGTSYTIQPGDVTGNTFVINETESSPLEASAHRDGLSDSATGHLSLREALITGLGSFSVSDNEVSLTVDCGTPGSETFSDNLADIPFFNTTYAANNLPSQVTLNDSGQLDYDFSCSLGSPESVSFGVLPTINAQGNSQDLEDLLVNISIDGVAQPQAPVLESISFNGDQISVVDGAFSSPLELVCGFSNETTGTPTINGDATFYSLSGEPNWVTVTENTIPYAVPSCPTGSLDATFLVQAHRDNLTTSAQLTLEAIKPLINRLNVNGNDYFIDGEEFEEVTIPCGGPVTGSYRTNVDEKIDGFTYAPVATLPDGFNLNTDGTFTYTPSCNPGSPETVFVNKNATKDGVTLDNVVSTYNITGVGAGQGPTIFGLDYIAVNPGDVDNPVIDGVTGEVLYFCNDLTRNMYLLSDDPDNTTYEIINENDYGHIDNQNRLRIATLSHPDCNTLEGLATEVVIRATNDSGSTDFTVPVRGHSPQIKHVYVEPAPTSGGSPRPSYIAEFDSNKFSEMINLPCDRVPGIPHRATLEPVISHFEVSQMHPTRSYWFESNNQPQWMGMAPSTGVISFSPGLPPTCQDNGFLLPRPEYTLRVNSTYGPNLNRLNLTITND